MADHVHVRPDNSKLIVSLPISYYYIGTDLRPIDNWRFTGRYKYINNNMLFEVITTRESYKWFFGLFTEPKVTKTIWLRDKDFYIYEQSAIYTCSMDNYETA